MQRDEKNRASRPPEPLRNSADIGLSPDCRILIADDDPIHRALAASVLRLAPTNIAVAEDGVDALEHLARDRFDLAILDLEMPRIDGFRLIAHIRHTSFIRHLPIVVVTGLVDRDAIEEVHRLGVNLYLNKPLNWELFPHQIGSVLKAISSNGIAEAKTPSAAA